MPKCAVGTNKLRREVSEQTLSTELALDARKFKNKFRLDWRRVDSRESTTSEIPQRSPLIGNVEIWNVVIRRSVSSCEWDSLSVPTLKHNGSISYNTLLLVRDNGTASRLGPPQLHSRRPRPRRRRAGLRQEKEPPIARGGPGLRRLVNRQRSSEQDCFGSTLLARAILGGKVVGL